MIVNAGQEQTLPDVYIGTTLKNLECYGYTFSLDLIDRLKGLSTREYIKFYQQLLQDIKDIVGAKVRYYPMYPNFPTQVMSEEESRLYLNAIVHYLTHWLPNTKIVKRFPLLDQVDLKVIGLGSSEEFSTMICNLLGAKTSISETDRTDISWVIAHEDNLNLYLPKELPHKENAAFLVSTLLTNEKIEMNQLFAYFKTATDVLRLAIALSGGDVSLATNTNFKKFKRSERRILLALLEKCPNRLEDMFRYKNRWIRLGEILHPGEYKHRYPRSKEAFDTLRNNEKVETYASKLELALERKNTTESITLLKERPGEFARKLDFLLRLFDETSLIIDSFHEVVFEVSTPVLLQVMTHFKHRTESQNLRTFFPKGNIAKMIAIENKLQPINEFICQRIVEICEVALLQRFNQLPSLGKVYLDEGLKQFVVPFSQRSASKALRTIVRGSKLDLPKGNTIRFFTWWKEGEVDGQPTGRVDIDLSAVMYDDDWNYKEHISFTNLRSKKYNACHSGDIVSAPDGACEFIDLDIESILKYGGRYVVMSLLSYSQQSFANLPECFTGWMIRQHPYSGEVFEPSTVQNRIDLASETQICIPVILDLKTRQVLWTDLALKRHPDFYNTIEANQRGMVAIGQALTTLKKPNLYDLFMLHAKARGILIKEIEEADTVLSISSGTTPFDIEEIIASYL